MTFDFFDFVGKTLNTPQLEPKPWMSDYNFVCVESLQELQELVDTIKTQEYFAIDLETTGLDNRAVDSHSRETRDKIVGFCLCSPADPKTGYYVPIRHLLKEGLDVKLHPKCLPILPTEQLIAQACKASRVVVHNSHFDLEFLHGIGISLEEPDDFDDTLILGYLRDNTGNGYNLFTDVKVPAGPGQGVRGRGLKSLSRALLGMEMFELSELFPPKQGVDFQSLDPTHENTRMYACTDAIATLGIYEVLKRYGKEQALIYKIEKSCVAAHRNMERNRVKIDVPFLCRLYRLAEETEEQAISHIYESCYPVLRGALSSCSDDQKRMILSKDFLGLPHKKMVHDWRADEHKPEQNWASLPAEDQQYIFREYFDPFLGVQGIDHFKLMVDVRSATQLGGLLETFSYLSARTGFKVDLVRTEKSGQVATDSTNIDILVDKYKDTFPFLAKIGVFRSLQKLMGTYLRPLLLNRDQEDKVRFVYKQDGTDTGRYAGKKGDPFSMSASDNLVVTKKHEVFIEHATSGRLTLMDWQALQRENGKRYNGASGINGQSIPACYSAKTLSLYEVSNRTSPGEEGSLLNEAFKSGFIDKGSLVTVRDHHFYYDPRTDKEYCIRASCEGCPLATSCQKSAKPVALKVLPLDEMVRCLLVPSSDDRVFLSIDQSGVELRVVTNIAREPVWMEEFLYADGDLHKITAQMIFGSPQRHVTVMPDYKSLRQKGKCLVGSTLVQTNQGLKTLESLSPGKTSPDTFTPISEVMVWTDQGVRSASHFYDGGVQPTIKVRTSRGYGFEATPTHRVRVLDAQNQYVWRETGDLALGDLILWDAGNPLHKQGTPELLAKTPSEQAHTLLAACTDLGGVFTFTSSLGLSWEALQVFLASLGVLSNLDQEKVTLTNDQYALLRGLAQGGLPLRDFANPRERIAAMVPCAVVSLEPSQAQVYDITVPGPESFWANGFIHHNSANFSIIYGGGGGAVARATGVSTEEGRVYKDKVLKGLPTLNNWFEQTKATAHRQKYVKTAFGRVLRLPDIDHEDGKFSSKAERNAINGIVQGSATGDLTKAAMAKVYHFLKAEGLLDACRLIMTTHDELTYDIKCDHLDKLIPIIVDYWCGFGPKLHWQVPLACDVEIGKSWFVTDDWGKIHPEKEGENAKAVVPSYLKPYIELTSGMRYIDANGKEAVVPWPESPEPPLEESCEVETVTPEQGPPEEEVALMSESPESPGSPDDVIASSPPKAPSQGQHPIYIYQTPYLFTEVADQKRYVRRLKRVLDFFEHTEHPSVSLTHTLEVTDSEGHLVYISRDDRYYVDPQLFQLLADYEDL